MCVDSKQEHDIAALREAGHPMRWGFRRRPPDFQINHGQLLRWFILPRNRLFNIYLHKVMYSDIDRALHDHPWWNISIVLRNGYSEVVPVDRTDHAKRFPQFHRKKLRRPGSIIFRRARAAHRLVIEEGAAPAITLFITGPKLRTWGFWCKWGFRPWREFVDARDSGKVGRGCD